MELSKSFFSPYSLSSPSSSQTHSLFPTHPTLWPLLSFNCYVCRCFAGMRIYIPLVYPLPKEMRGGSRSIWYCSCRLLCAIMWLLGTKAGSSIRAATVLYCWPISCQTSFLKKYILRSSSTICASHLPFNVCPSIECGWPTRVTHLKKTLPPPLSNYPLPVLSHLGVRPHSSSPLDMAILCDLSVCRACICCQNSCHFICAPASGCPENTSCGHPQTPGSYNCSTSRSQQL